MCRMIALTCDQYLSPLEAINGLEAMREGYDGSGMGLLMRDLGGPFKAMRNSPILSGIFSVEGLKRLDKFMLKKGFTTKYKISFKLASTPPTGIPKRDVYLLRAYDYPSEYDELSLAERCERFMQFRLELKRMGQLEQDMIVFAFWPDTVVIKEIGEPTELARYLDLGREVLQARLIMAQGSQNTNSEIDLYECHPSFLQGFATMANGENTAFGPNREFLASRGFAGYNGCHSDSEIFTHSLHFTISRLGMGIEAFKHIITPLDKNQIRNHPDGQFLTHLKHVCRHLIIDGPNCVVGCLADNSVFMAQDRKKLRPGVVGGGAGKYIFASEVCALDAVMPERDHRKDFQPMNMDTVVVGPERRHMSVYRQTDPMLAN